MKQKGKGKHEDEVWSTVKIAKIDDNRKEDKKAALQQGDVSLAYKGVML